MLRILLAIPLVLAFTQDDATIQDHIRRLDDSDLEVREKALRELIKAGSKALEPLRKVLASESAEVRSRATQAIRAIESELQSREAYPAYKAWTLKRSGTVGEILDDLVKLTGVRVEASAEHRAKKTSVDAATLFQALDQICAGSEALTFTLADDGTVRFSAERHPQRPASYVEAFKFYVAECQALRKTDFKETTVTGQVSIHAVWESRLKPLRRVVYEFVPAQDDAGREIEIGPGSAMGMMPPGAAIMVIPGGDDLDPGSPQTFALKGLVPGAKSVAVLKGSATVSFPLGRVEVAFEDPQGGSKHTTGDLSIKLTNVNTSKNRISVTFGKPKGDGIGLKDEILARLDSASVRAIDERGNEHIGELLPAQAEMGAGIVIGGPGVQSKYVQFTATFDSLKGLDIKRFTFKISDALFEKKVPFEIKDIKLP